MRESRLRALELKAAVARSTHHSPNRLSAVRVEENTRHNAAIGREFTFGTTPQQMRVPNSAANASSGSKSVTLSNESGQKLQRNIADDVRKTSINILAIDRLCHIFPMSMIFRVSEGLRNACGMRRKFRTARKHRNLPRSR